MSALIDVILGLLIACALPFWTAWQAVETQKQILTLSGKFPYAPGEKEPDLFDKEIEIKRLKKQFWFYIISTYGLSVLLGILGAVVITIF